MLSFALSMLSVLRKVRKKQQTFFLSLKHHIALPFPLPLSFSQFERVVCSQLSSFARTLKRTLRLNSGSQSLAHTYSECVSSVNTNRKPVIKLSIKRTSFIELSHLQRTKFHGNYRSFTIKIDVIDTPREWTWIIRPFRYAVYRTSFLQLKFVHLILRSVSVLFFYVDAVRNFTINTFLAIFAPKHTLTRTHSLYVSAAGYFGKSEIHLAREYLNSTQRNCKKDHAICLLFIHY